MRWDVVPLQPGEVRVTRNSRTVSWIGKLGAAVALVYVLALLRSSTDVLSLYGGALAGLAMLGCSVAVNRRRCIATGARLAFEDDELVVRTDEVVRAIPRDAIAGGYFDGGRRLTFVLKGGEQIDFGCDAQTAERLLEEAGVSTEQRSLALKLASWASQHPLANAAAHAVGGLAVTTFAVLTLGALFGLAEGWLLEVIHRWPWWLASGATWWTTSRLTRPRTVTIGTDALIIRGAFTTRCVPMRDIACVEEDERGVTLELADGSNIALPAHATRAVVSEATAEDADARRALGRRIHAALRRDRSTDLSPDALRFLERGNRSAEEWTATMLGLTERSGRYRERAISRERLARTVSDANLSDEQRTGAALALSGEHDTHWERIEISAAASADPELSRALRAAASGRVPNRLRIAVPDDTDAEEEAHAAEEEAARVRSARRQ